VGATQEKVSDASYTASALLCELNPHFSSRVTVVVGSTVPARRLFWPATRGKSTPIRISVYSGAVFHRVDSRGHLKSNALTKSLAIVTDTVVKCDDTTA
jgi:hypothetical protein